MAKLLYSVIMSLDGYVADEDGTFDWAAPDDEVHMFVNDLERSVGTYLHGRRMYEVMVAWEAMDLADEPGSIRDFAEIWRSADKIVFSTTLASASSARTTIARTFDPDDDPAADGVVGARPQRGWSPPRRSGDRCRTGRRVPPVRRARCGGGGTAGLPNGVRLDLELLDERRFGNGTVYLRYATDASGRAVN